MNFAQFDAWTGNKRPTKKDPPEAHRYYSFTKWLGRISTISGEPEVTYIPGAFHVALDKTKENKKLITTMPVSWEDDCIIVYKWKSNDKSSRKQSRK